MVHCISILLRSDVAQSTNIVILSGEAAPDGGIVVNTPPGKKGLCFYFLGYFMILVIYDHHKFDYDGSNEVQSFLI